MVEGTFKKYIAVVSMLTVLTMVTQLSMLGHMPLPGQIREEGKIHDGLLTLDHRYMDQIPIMNRWQARGLNNPDKGGYLFFKHIRKAGGSSMYKYLSNILRYHHEQRLEAGSGFPKGEVAYYEQESFSMDWKCPQIDDRWNSTLSIIVLRHPIERHMSEFFYHGPGRTNPRLASLQKRQNYTKEYTSLIRKLLPEWILKGNEKTQQEGEFGRYFSENYQTRALAGETSRTPDPFTTPKSYCIKNCLRNKCPPKGCDGPCSYGSSPPFDRGYKLGRGGVHVGPHQTTIIQNRRALHVLKSFDMILLTESLRDPEQSEFIADVLNVPSSWKNLSLATMDKANVGTISKVTQQDHRQQDNAYRHILQQTAPELIDLLASHSQYEMELYNHAVQLNEGKIQQWKREKIARDSIKFE